MTRTLGLCRYRDHELGLIGEGIKKTLIMAAMMSFMTFKLGLHLPVVRCLLFGFLHIGSRAHATSTPAAHMPPP